MLLMAKEELVYARISTELKRKLQMAMSQRGEAEAVIIREALNLYFAHLDRTAPPVPPPTALRETAPPYQTPPPAETPPPEEIARLRQRLREFETQQAKLHKKKPRK